MRGGEPLGPPVAPPPAGALVPGVVVVTRGPAIQPAVQWIAAGGALSSGAALVASILTDRPLWLASSFILVPGLVAFTAATVMARRDEQTLFLTRVGRGLVAGVLATLAYDLGRWAVEAPGLSPTDSFKAMPIFGAGLTDLPSTHAAAIAAGWAFHFVNGIGFATCFMLLVAGRPWWWGVVFALTLEAFMVWLYPGWLGITVTSEFLSVTIGGHLAYGAVLGRFAQGTP